MVMTAARRRVTDKTEVKEVPLALLDPGPVAKLCDPLPGTVVEDLAALMAQEDLLSCHVFMVRAKTRRNGSKQRYELVNGNECLRAAKAVRQQTVKVIVVNGMTDTQAVALSAIHNRYQPRLSSISQARFGQYALDRLGVTLATAAKLIRLSERTLTRRMRYLKLPKDVQALLETKQLKPGHIEELLRLKTGPAQRQVAYETVRSSLTVEQLRDYLYPDHRQVALEEITGDAPAPSSQSSGEETQESSPQELLRQIGQLVEQVAIASQSVSADEKPALDQQIGALVERLQGIKVSCAPY